MLGYTWIQWLFFFFFYSFFGWCFESTYVSLHEKRFVNRGFIRGPFLPLYGTGALMMLIVSMPFQDNLILTYVAGCVGATVLEYITGVLMETLFKVRYWDYSHKKFNFQGQICLESSLAWGLLTILMTRMIHKPIEAFAFWLPSSVLTGVTMVVTVIFAADFALSFKAALDLRDVLVRMEQAKDELEKMQRRLDVILAVSEENWENRKKEFPERDGTATIAEPAIFHRQRMVLDEIMEVLRRHGTSIRVLISPDYNQKKLHPDDREILQGIFGKENVYDFSGINEFTEDYHNYYEAGHYRPLLGNKLLERIYKRQ